jgi:pimeloyl-ACP methyl ester carboxylesterase
VIQYEVHNGTGPYLLLLHGALSNSAQWLLNLDALGEFCTPVTAELLGHGDSPSPDDPAAYLPEAYVADFERIRCELNVPRWHLCGYSLSAGLTIRYALDYPEVVASHSFTNSMSAFADCAQQTLWSLSAAKTRNAIVTGGLRAIEKMHLHPRFATTLPAQVYGPLLERAKLLNPIGVAHTLTTTAPAASVREDLTQNQVPALLLQGTREQRFEIHVKYAATHMRQLKVVQLAAGHGVNMQAPVEFNQALREHLNECPI